MGRKRDSEDLKREHNSRPRNPVIANACFLGGYIDTWGRGTLKILNTCKEAGLPEPEINEMNGGVSITLFNNLQASVPAAVQKASGKHRESVGKNSGCLS